MVGENHSTLGERLRQERLRLGLTQEELANCTGIHRRTQANYELGKTAPDMAYFQALRRVGLDPTYIETGTKSSLSDEQSSATERLFLALCDALQIPLEKVYAAINGAAEVRMASSVFQGYVGSLINSSPMLNSKNKVLVLDRDILVDIIDGFERCLKAMNKRVSPLQKAHYIASMYRDFCEKGEIDTEMLEAGARSIPEA
jgi:transcriptional regulator with XRE-family HTH domain